MIIKNLNNIFHKHSRWLFGAFTIIIIVSFMGFLTPGQFGCDGFGMFGAQKVGTAFGKTVTLDDLETLIRENHVLSLVGLNAGRDMGYQQAFQEYCVLASARKRGLSVTDTEVIGFVKKFPAFQKDGQYDPALYKKFKELLTREGGNDELLIGALRNMLLISKLQTALGENIVVTENELETLYRRLNIRYTVKAALFDLKDYLKDVKNDPKAMKKYFDAHRAAYRTEGKIGGFLVEFPVASYAKAAGTLASEENLKKFYETNSQLFTRKGKVEKYEDCKAQVKAEFIKNASRNMTLRAAYEFAGQAYEAVGDAESGRAEAFLKTAAGSKLKVTDTGMIDFGAAKIGNLESPALVKELVSAYDTHWVTNPALVGDRVYVGFAKEKIDPRPAEFNAVAARIAADYRNAEAMRLASAAAEKAEILLDKVPEGPARAKAFEALKGCTFKTFHFVLGSEMPPMDYIPSALAALQLKVDGVSPVIPGDNGPQLALLLKRTPTDMKDFAAQKEQLRSNLRMMKLQLFQGEFWEELAAQCQASIDLSKR